jgi:Mg2+ and Co2+ transporter CorA
MTTRREWGDVVWVDVENPTAKEIRSLIDEWHIPPEVGEELSRPSWRPRAERYGEMIHATLHFPIPRRKKDSTAETDDEIDFIVGRRFISTVRYRSNEALYHLGKEVEAAALSKKPSPHGGGSDRFARILRVLYDMQFSELGENTERLGKIEKEIFRGNERAMVEPLSEAGRELLDMQRATSFHKELLESFARAAAAIGENSGTTHTRMLLSELMRLEFAIRRNLDLLSELRETNNSLLNARESATMRVIAVVAFLTLPASILTNFFQMGTSNTPLVGIQYDWFIITGITLAITVALVILAKIKKWF